MFYNEVMSFNETEVTATCCKLDNTPISVTCGQGQSCAASCFSREASLCPSRDCNACDNFEETQQVGRRSLATTDASEWGWCSARGGNNCNVNGKKKKGCCFNPICQRRRRKKCSWLQFTIGKWNFDFRERNLEFSGKLFHVYMIYLQLSSRNSLRGMYDPSCFWCHPELQQKAHKAYYVLYFSTA